MSPVDWQLAHIPLAAGMQQKADDRALEPPALAVCLNAEFDEIGGIQKRKPFEPLSSAIYYDGEIGPGGPPVLENIRRLAVYEGELLAFTDAAIYSYSETAEEWVWRSSYLAPAVIERTVSTKTSEQTMCDRAELDGVAVYAWLDQQATAQVQIVAIEVVTGLVLLGPASMGANTTRPRLVALESRILLFCQTDTNEISVKSLDLEDLVNSAVASFTAIDDTNFSDYYDVAPQSATAALLAYRRATTTSHSVVSVSEDLGVISSSTKARTCDGPIAVATAPSGLVAVIRADDTDIQGDILSDTLVDVEVGNAVGTAATAVNQIAAAFKLTQDSDEYRCHAVWHGSQQSAPATNFESKTNWIDTAGDVGTQAVLVNRMGVGSRAFAYGDTVLVWMAFAISSTTSIAQLQNSYFLYDVSGALIAKAAPGIGGGYPAEIGHLPGVQSLSDTRFACCLVERRVIPLGQTEKGYSQRSPREVILDLDANEARRPILLGRTLYLTGGQVLQYDGRGLNEVGFPLFPYNISVLDDGTAGSLEAGTYAWRPTIRWENARGELERSTSATFFDAAIAASRRAKIATSPVHVTSKRVGQGQAALEIWRTLKDPTPEAPYYLITSKDPTATGANGYLANDVETGNYSTYEDNLADANAAMREPNPEGVGVLESLAPPAATIIATGQDRLFLAGVAHDPHRVAYSRLRGDQEVASFHDVLVVDLPSGGGPITALAHLNETLVAFKASALYMLPGDGFDNLGGGQNYGPARQVALDVGAQSAESIAVTPQGILFRSDKGWHLLDRSWSVTYVGAPVSDYDDDTLVGIQVLEGQHQIRVVSTARILVYDTLVRQWSEWEEAGCVGSVMWGGRHVIATATSVLRQATDYTAASYALDVETAWIKTAGLQGFARARRIHVLGEDRGAAEIRVRCARNYDMDAGEPNWFDDKLWTPSPGVVGGPLQVAHRLSRQKSQAVKVRLTDGQPAASLYMDPDEDTGPTTAIPGYTPPALGSGPQHVYLEDVGLSSAATWETWFKQLATPVVDHTLFSQFLSGANAHYRLTLSPSGGNMYANIVGLEDDGTGVEFDMTSTSPIVVPARGWYHLAVVFDGAEAAADRWKVYLDGVAVPMDMTGAPPASLFACTEPIRLGCTALAADATDDHLRGNMFECRIWNIARSASEIAANVSTTISAATGLVASGYRTASHRNTAVTNADFTPVNSPTFSGSVPYAPAVGEGYALTGLAIEYGVKRGPMRLPATQRQ